MQIQCLHYCNGTCIKEQVCVPPCRVAPQLFLMEKVECSVTGLASSWWLGDIEKMEIKMLGAFSSHFLNVGYSLRCAKMPAKSR